MRAAALTRRLCAARPRCRCARAQRDAAVEARSELAPSTAAGRSTHVGLARAASRFAQLLWPRASSTTTPGTPFAHAGRGTRRAPAVREPRRGSGQDCRPDRSSGLDRTARAPRVMLDCRFSQIGVGVATGSFGDHGAQRLRRPISPPDARRGADAPHASWSVVTARPGIRQASAVADLYRPAARPGTSACCGRPPDLVPNWNEAAWQLTRRRLDLRRRRQHARRQGAAYAARRRSRRPHRRVRRARVRAAADRHAAESRAQGDDHRPRGQPDHARPAAPAELRDGWPRCGGRGRGPAGGGAPRACAGRPRAPRAPRR